MKWIQNINPVDRMVFSTVYIIGIIINVYRGLFSPFSLMMIYLTIKAIFFICVNIKLSNERVIIGKRKYNSLITSIYMLFVLLLVYMMLYILRLRGDDLLLYSMIIIVSWNFLLFLIMWSNTMYEDNNEQVTKVDDSYTMIGYQIEDESKYNKLIILTNKLFIKCESRYIITLITVIEVIIYRGLSLLF